MATVEEIDVAIVGGGMGGLALAVGLQHRGIQAHVFEKSPEERKHFGTGMSIGQNGKLRNIE
jgi:2-polyprenyl-6-methoxyphenol hydroxylase-like FAD-dependent oxidoreductase